MPEILKHTEKYINPCIRCATSMANYADIDLSVEQINQYADLRTVSESNPLSDQRLLYLILEPLQQEAFKIKYSHINFDEKWN
jgi:hypothetical protein